MVTYEQLAFYEENGYLLVKGLFSREEAAAWRQECHALAERLAAHHSIDATWGSAREASNRRRSFYIVTMFSSTQQPLRASLLMSA